jgi:hypothetical protein
MLKSILTLLQNGYYFLVDFRTYLRPIFNKRLISFVISWFRDRICSLFETVIGHLGIPVGIVDSSRLCSRSFSPSSSRVEKTERGTTVFPVTRIGWLWIATRSWESRRGWKRARMSRCWAWARIHAVRIMQIKWNYFPVSRLKSEDEKRQRRAKWWRTFQSDDCAPFCTYTCVYI